MEGLVWILSENGSKCDKPIVVDKEAGTESFVAAARHQGGHIPGVLWSGKSHAFIPWDGDSISKKEYYVLSNSKALDLVWETAGEGKVPLGAVCGGKSEDGEDLYIGRVKIDAKYIAGKFHPSHKVTYVPHDGREKGFSEYEILCVKKVPCVINEKEKKDCC